MKTQFTKLIMLLLCLLCFGGSSFAQDLTGTWRLKNLKTIKGSEYVNALPKQMVINQTPDGVEFKLTSNLGDRDSVISQLLSFNSINESKTHSGKKKLVTIQKKADGSWLKHTKVFSNNYPKELLGTDDETYTLDKEGGLTLLRVYDSTDEVKAGIQDYTAEASYEKLDPESAAREAAKGKGVNFVQGLNWEQIKAKAKAENKYIFVDCYATWCGPCKVMDMEVYPLNMVGEAMNEQFISIKIQMDSTKNDSPSVRPLYAAARELEKKYNITGLPSYLFFSPSGEIIHKDMGARNPDEFLNLLKDAINPNKQLYSLIKQIHAGEMDVNLIPGFIKHLEDKGEKSLSTELTRYYMKNYLEKLPEKDFLTRKNLDLIFKYPRTLMTQDRIYQAFCNQANIVDSLMEYPGFSDAAINWVFSNEFVQPTFDQAKLKGIAPDWKQILATLWSKTTKERANVIILNYKVAWYKGKKDWDNYVKYLFQRTKNENIESPNQSVLGLNSTAWDLFEYSFDKKALELGLKYIDKSIALWAKSEGSAGLLDTKANLLYKLGRNEEAILLQKQAVLINPASKGLKKTLEKMLSKEKTWEFGANENRKVK
ncbi:thioredoxin family protein [Pedobacter heparinus]|uniref:Thioredoxin domain protein n=1 Tax=Pedobacter heparinus (strain ATCC 13125 / DSM 2366 / CIP 104194 / JCM 7457 / NBRC 12017 / NCIMB 9290 / NRRL B-14731 / HIM 762-3) TaxID=485917 RepID=C6XVE5_PEDHD|nr:DUF255 domain-containing protein [Pedobacter heparinus]ACU04011.1 Thioredoxin domain protein [Pedobacter heparinus DSM 2366]